MIMVVAGLPLKETVMMRSETLSADWNSLESLGLIRSPTPPQPLSFAEQYSKRQVALLVCS